MSDNPSELARYFFEQSELNGLSDRADFWRTLADGFSSGHGVPDSHLETAIGELMRMVEMCDLASYSEDDLIIDSLEAARKRAERLIELLEYQRYEKPETHRGSSLNKKKAEKYADEEQ